MEITRSGMGTMVGPEDWFAGGVYLDIIGQPSPPSRVLAGLVRFSPGARTTWHSHPVGQTIFVTEGVSLCQREGGPIEVLHPGDRVFFGPDENHWHGATSNRFSTQIAYDEADEAGNHTNWGRHVTDAEYTG